MNENIKKALDYIFSYASDVDDWMTIKKEFLKVLPPRDRIVFSTRDPKTKKQRTNDFERELAAIWSQMTGRRVVFRDDETKRAQEDDSP